MSHYKSNLRDIEFNLFEVLGRDDVLGSGPFAEVDSETARSILAEVDRLAREDLAASYDGQRPQRTRLRPRDRRGPAPRVVQEELPRLDGRRVVPAEIPEALGGQPAPSSLNWAIGELVLGSNAPVWMYGAGPRFASVMHRNGNERDQKIAGHMVERGWDTTMVLTEPDAGSDVGAGRTKATPNDDGTWNIDGRQALHHLGRARPVRQHHPSRRSRAPAAWRGPVAPAPRGSSLFIVPKHHFDVETGELTGERNGVKVTDVEHKMGIKVSNTCEVTFGDSRGGDEPARGWLLGEVHDGIAQMFQVIENARMMVGTKAIATLSTGYLNALDYAKERMQGADLTEAADKTAPRVAITHHPDVRRSLMTQKAFAEAMRRWCSTRRPGRTA